MEKKNDTTKIILGLGVIIGIIILSYVFFPAGSRQTSTPEDSSDYYADLEESEGIIASSDIFTEETDAYIINVRYIVVSGLEDEEKQTSLNKKIKDFAMEPISYFKTEVEEAEVFENMISGFYLEPEITFLSEGLISIRFASSEYFSGAAHPNNYTLVFNYDITRDKGIALEDLFLPEIDYLTTLSNLTRTALFEHFEEDLGAMQDWIELGTEAQEKNFQSFSFTKDILTIYFDPYQIGPYALGVQTVEITFEDLGEYINFLF